MAKTSTDVFISKKSIVIRNRKTENLAKLDVQAFFICKAFFKSASLLDIGHKLNVHKMFRRRLMYVYFMSCVYGVSVA